MIYLLQHLNFRGEKYVGRKSYKNCVMDLACVNMSGTNKKYFCYWKMAHTTLLPKYMETSH
jgi:hypothetical protein